MWKNPTLPVRRVYDAVAVANRQNVPPTQFESVRSIMNREIHRNLPPIPADIREVNIQGDWARTWNDNLFRLHHDTNVGVTIFATDADCRLLQRCATLYLDGTFRTATHPDVQLLTIHGEMNGFVVKFAYCLLPNKTQRSYQRVWKF